MSEPKLRVRWGRVMAFLAIVATILCWPRIWAWWKALGIASAAPMPLPPALDNDAGRGLLVLCVIVVCGLLAAKLLLQREPDPK